MPRVVPSQVVGLIDQLFPSARVKREGSPLTLSRENSIQVAAVLELIQQVPPELIVLKADQYAEYVSSIATLKDLIEQWRARDFGFHYIPGLRKHSPISLIRQALDICLDEVASVGTTELAFIEDAGLRENLRLDISAVNNALSNGQWKGATVLAGSVIEALLLWALQAQPPAAVQTSIARLLASKTLSTKPDNNLEKWEPHEYLEVTADLGLIKQDTATQARLAKNYRNLIHPGRAQRLGQVCNRPTALTAVAAMERVREDITP